MGENYRGQTAERCNKYIWSPHKHLKKGINMTLDKLLEEYKGALLKEFSNGTKTAHEVAEDYLRQAYSLGQQEGIKSQINVWLKENGHDWEITDLMEALNKIKKDAQQELLAKIEGEVEKLKRPLTGDLDDEQYNERFAVNRSLNQVKEIIKRNK